MPALIYARTLPSPAVHIHSAFMLLAIFLVSITAVSIIVYGGYRLTRRVFSYLEAKRRKAVSDLEACRPSSPYMTLN